MSNDRARAKTLILKWFDGGNSEPAVRGRLSAGIDRFFDEIAKRESWSECISTILGDESAPAIVAKGATWRSRPCRAGLAFSSFVPGWGYGWSTILKDEFVYGTLSWFGHYARQYIHRSNIAKILMIAWEQHEAILHPFGSEGSYSRYGASRPSVTPKEALDGATEDIDRKWGAIPPLPASTRSAWTHRNTLDPAVHQAIFHFLRAQSLRQADFELEALAAFDCVLQSLQAMDWSWAPGVPRRSRADLCLALGFKAPNAALAEQVYFLRNQFVVHAGGWRWWDAEEYLNDDLMAKISNLTLRALRRAADLEPSHRRIDPSPLNWGDWLVANFSLLWDSVWFRDFP
jgi:hypothetical protein